MPFETEEHLSKLSEIPRIKNVVIESAHEQK